MFVTPTLPPMNPNTSFQLGRIQAPAQVLRHGGYPSEAMAKNRSAKVYVTDPDTIAFVHRLEKQACEKYPECKLNSSIVSTETLADGRPLCLLRTKFTKKQRCFRTDVPQHVEKLDEIGYGDLILAKCSVSDWSMEGQCGIVIYANIIRCVGVSTNPAGERYESNAMEWS